MEFRYPWRFDSRRSAVMATGGVVATSSPVAARVGARVLEDGGTAADAAVATAAVLNVVEPHMTGVGGDAFALTHFDGEYDALNGSGGAPADADREAYRARTDETRPSPVDGTERPRIPFDGGMPVTAPGALDAWQRLLDRYGRRSLADALAPAVEYARDGVPIPEYVARQWARSADRLRRFDESAETFLPGGSAPDPGDRFRNPALADTFETIADDGVEAFYGGDIGEAVVETVQAHGGDLSLADLAAHESEWTDPISTEYGGVEVLEHPPNGQGAIALEALNVAGEFDLPADPRDPDRLHRLVEATKIAFADGYAHVADPARADVPLDAMLSREYAADRAAEVGRDAGIYEPRAGAWTPGDNTVYLTVVDGDGNAVSFINSIYMSFGSALTARGFALQNRGTAFSLDPDHPNALEPGKRPFHTIIPAMLRENGEFRASWGVMGGSMQPQGHLQVAAAMVDSGLNPQAALDAPRFRWLERDRVALETSRLPDATVADLRDCGHDVVAEDEFFDDGGHWGGGQVIVRRDDGTLVAGSDPRRDGQAVGF